MKDAFEIALNLLLSENISAAMRREAKEFDRLIGDPSKKVILFGSGDLGKRTLGGLRELGIGALCFADNNSKLWNSEIDGLIVLSPEEALRKYPHAVFVLTIWSAGVGHPLREVRQQLNISNESKIVSFFYLYWKYPDTFLPYWRCELPHKTIEQFDLVSGASSLWSDDLSKKEYLAQVHWRITGDSSKLTSPVKFDQYFPDDLFKINNKEVFVDIGAFDGDTLEKFLEKSDEKFEHYYAYEPDPFGYKKLNEYVASFPSNIGERIKAEAIGIASQNESIEIETPGDYFKIRYPEEVKNLVSKGELRYVSVPSKPIDDLEFKHAPTYIKMDVEGFEPNIIFGAKQTIKKYQPIMAIAIYHKFDHLWRLPLVVNAISDGYNFYLRPHCKAGWELICYAVPRHRVPK